MSSKEMTGGDVIAMLILFFLAVGFAAFCGYSAGTSSPNESATNFVRCKLACQLHGEKLLMLAPTDECICEHARLRAGEMVCK